MQNKIVFKSSDEMNFISTNHHTGLKKVLITDSDCASDLTQAAIGTLSAGQEIENHKHQTMEEFFFFSHGFGLFNIEGEDYECKAGTFIKIPLNKNHRLKAIENLKFIYWGVAI
ncbi:cupin domain-containing protein [Lutimonas zeaxanthinifaciens]|uniref:cupin domain-containing protein n=1 Tax=Lutimonas zeaxanthinifaciens TaxID=3060215 RepID=UPI00265CE74C|nr:cupin domain-containing protein [Lutimonas sp. YSD2104]WKK66469.1 cupin domain-containing protein [Lutimonas sp. YSD2104]